MIVKMSDITSKGHGLLAKVLAGTAALNLTATHCGDGEYDGDPWDLEELISPKLTGEIVSMIPYPKERRTELVLRFTNQEVTGFFQLREIGIYALDPDEGKILYAYANYGERANFIEEFSGQWHTEDEITFYIYTANATNINAEITKTSVASEIGYDNSISGLVAKNVQNALDEIVAACKKRIIISDVQPEGQTGGDFWYDTSGEQPDPSGVVMLNVVVSDIEPESKFVWFDTGAGI